MRKQISLACTMGIEHMIILVNKMDITDPPYSKDRFDEIKTEILLHLKKIGCQVQNVIFIPISAWLGDNLIEPSNKMCWFTGQTINSQENAIVCKTLLEALDNIVFPSQPIDKPLRLVLQAMHKRKDGEIMLVGCIETGILKPGMSIHFAPANISASVKAIQMHYETIDGK